MIEWIMQPWPWWVAGPLIGLLVPAMLWINNRQFGISSNLRHLCAVAVPGRVPFLQYDWRRHGLWNLVFVLGIMIGAFLAGAFLGGDGTSGIAEATRGDLAAMGIHSTDGWAPVEIFAWERLTDVASLVILIGGGFLIGFGTRYAGGCTSGHAITGLSLGRPSSLVAVVGFFVGGLLATHVLLPMLLGGAS